MPRDRDRGCGACRDRGRRTRGTAGGGRRSVAPEYADLEPPRRSWGTGGVERKRGRIAAGGRGALIRRSIIGQPLLQPGGGTVKTIGVLGGVGPQATMDFERRMHDVSRRLIPPNGNRGYPPMIVHYHRRPPVRLREDG